MKMSKRRENNFSKSKKSVENLKPKKQSSKLYEWIKSSPTVETMDNDRLIKDPQKNKNRKSSRSREQDFLKDAAKKGIVKESKLKSKKRKLDRNITPPIRRSLRTVKPISKNITPVKLLEPKDVTSSSNKTPESPNKILNLTLKREKQKKNLLVNDSKINKTTQGSRKNKKRDINISPKTSQQNMQLKPNNLTLDKWLEKVATTSPKLKTIKDSKLQKHFPKNKIESHRNPVKGDLISLESTISVRGSKVIKRTNNEQQKKDINLTSLKRLQKDVQSDTKNVPLDKWFDQRGGISSSQLKTVEKRKLVTDKSKNKVAESPRKKIKHNAALNTTEKNSTSRKRRNRESKNATPTTKGNSKCNVIEKLDKWLIEKEVIPSAALEISPSISAMKSNIGKSNNQKRKLAKPLDIQIQKPAVNGKKNVLTKEKPTNKQRKTSIPKNAKITYSPTKQSTLKQYLNKNNKNTPFMRNDSFDSCELPTFVSNKKKERKSSSNSKEKKALFKKYGVVLPTVDEILRDKEDVELVKQRLESFVPMNDDSLDLLFSESVLKSPVPEQSLDCKHLSVKQLKKLFSNNLSYISDIVNEKVKNVRHQRYFDKNYKALTFSTNDLTYNTSTIVFTYQQISHLMDLLKQHFDPDVSKTQYFFQVLLPELCFNIFKEVHNMTREEAAQYLEERPILA